MELCTGGDLFSYLESKDTGCLDDLEACVISRQVVHAIQYLHSKDVAHRDIKLENIMLTRLDVGHRVVLTDFGTAMTCHSAKGRMYSQVGTHGYAAP